MARFNVLKEPWIPVERLDGRMESMGILGVLEQAHDLRQIACESPLEAYAVTRLLIAFLMDAYTPKSIWDRKKLLKEKQFSTQTLAQYVSLCERERNSFDLFDEKRRFMQAA